MLAVSCLGLVLAGGAAGSAQAEPTAAEMKELFGDHDVATVRDDLRTNEYAVEWQARLTLANADGLCDPKSFDNDALGKIDKILRRSPMRNLDSPDLHARHAVAGSYSYTNEFRRSYCDNSTFRGKYIAAKKKYTEDYSDKLILDEQGMLKFYYVMAIDLYNALKEAGAGMAGYFDTEKLTEVKQPYGECYTSTWKPPPAEPGTKDVEEANYVKLCKPKDDPDE